MIFAASSASAGVFCQSKEKRTVDKASSSVRPLAMRFSEARFSPLEQAEPVDTITP
nr:MAG TPA: hypothetical protein [Caudoviricetes sp.]